MKVNSFSGNPFRQSQIIQLLYLKRKSVLHHEFLLLPSDLLHLPISGLPDLDAAFMVNAPASRVCLQHARRSMCKARVPLFALELVPHETLMHVSDECLPS